MVSNCYVKVIHCVHSFVV